MPECEPDVLEAITVVEYYNADAADSTSIIYTFPRSQMGVEILIHIRVSLGEFKRLLLQFYKITANQDVIQTDDLEIRVTKRAQPASRARGVPQSEDDEDGVPAGE